VAGALGAGKAALPPKLGVGMVVLGLPNGEGAALAPKLGTGAEACAPANEGVEPKLGVGVPANEGVELKFGVGVAWVEKLDPNGLGAGAPPAAAAPKFGVGMAVLGFPNGLCPPPKLDPKV